MNLLNLQLTTRSSFSAMAVTFPAFLLLTLSFISRENVLTIAGLSVNALYVLGNKKCAEIFHASVIIFAQFTQARLCNLVKFVRRYLILHVPFRSIQKDIWTRTTSTVSHVECFVWSKTNLVTTKLMKIGK